MKKSSFFYYFSFIIYVVLFCTGRFVLLQKVAGARIALQAVFADLGMAFFILLLTALLQRIHIVVSAFILFILSLFHIASMEMAAAMNTYIDILDLRFAADAHFMRGSLSNVTYPWYSFFLLSVVILHITALRCVGRRGLIKLRYILPCIFISLLSVRIFSPRGDDWLFSNLLWLSLTRSIPRPLAASDSPLIVKTGVHTTLPVEKNDGEFYLHQQPVERNDSELYFHRPSGAERNILCIVLEGIPGVYVRQVQECSGVRYPVVMQNLSRIAERSLIVPNFIAHNRQTMRGLYSMLSGDYCKLTITTPKVYEYAQLPRERRNPCLPEILTKAGYTTVYLQAADLAFMSKNKFMPESGYGQVLGKQFFQYQHVPFGWGPDDKAFFEQAADFIVKVNRKSKPWFLTLLNVGTHHPYAIPDEFGDNFPSRKEAAVAYLDEALGDFFERMKGEKILSDTLVVITCDESHGVTGQPYGNYWGLAVVCSPESSSIINPGIFGLIDIPYSILDYLGFVGRPNAFTRCSVFRKQHTERPILFGPFLSEKRGVVTKRIDSSCVKIYQSSNGELFASEYVTRIVKGEEGKKLSERLFILQRAADSSLCDRERRNRQYILLENDVFILGPAENRVLSSGQYLDFPSRVNVTVELKAKVEPVGGVGGEESGPVRLVLQMLECYQKMGIPEVCIPLLENKNTLDLSFSFYTQDPIHRVWAYLKAKSVDQKYPVRLTVERFSIETENIDKSHEFRMNRFLIKNKEGTSSDLKASFQVLDEYNRKHVHPKPQSSKMKRGEEHSTSTFDHKKKYAIDFMARRLDRRYAHYIILIHFENREQELDGSTDVSMSLNGHPVVGLWNYHGREEKVALLYCERALLKEKDVNILVLTADAPEAGGVEPFPEQFKPPGFEILHLIIRPCPPPVAHAGGGYKGLTYTNSIEALEEHSRTFTLFEIDLEWTKDKQLIGLHDWKDIFPRVFGFNVQEPLEYDVFRKLDAATGFTPVDLYSIKKFLANHPEARIITDIKSDNITALRKIAGFFPDFSERFIPQVYQPEEFIEARDIGYKDIIWTLYQYPQRHNASGILSHIWNWEKRYDIKPFAITMPVHAVEEGIAKVVADAGIPVYAHTINTFDEYLRLLLLGVCSIYTDFLDISKCYTASTHTQTLTNENADLINFPCFLR